MSEKAVSDSTQDKTLKKQKKEKPIRADEPLHAKDVAPEKLEAKINKYGFLHVNGKLAKHLGVEFGKDKTDVPVSIECIEGGFTIKVKPTS
jgi:hypothetical protein